MIEIVNKEVGPIQICLKSHDGKRTLAKPLTRGRRIVVDEHRLDMVQIERLRSKGHITVRHVKS